MTDEKRLRQKKILGAQIKVLSCLPGAEEELSPVEIGDVLGREMPTCPRRPWPGSAQSAGSLPTRPAIGAVLPVCKSSLAPLDGLFPLQPLTLDRDGTYLLGEF